MTFAKRRFRIICTVIAMVLVTIMMSVGIYAANNVSVKNTGVVTFTANDVCASFNVYKLHNKSDVAVSDTAFAARSYDVNNGTGEAVFTDDTIALADFPFYKATDYYTIAFVVTNKFDADSNIGVSVTTSNFIITPTAHEDDIVVNTTLTGFMDGKLLAGQTGTYTITISLSDSLKETGTTSNIGFEFTLELDRIDAVTGA